MVEVILHRRDVKKDKIFYVDRSLDEFEDELIIHFVKELGCKTGGIIAKDYRKISIWSDKVGDFVVDITFKKVDIKQVSDLFDSLRTFLIKEEKVHVN